MLACDPNGLGWMCFNCDITASNPALDTLHKAPGNGCGDRGLHSNSNSNAGSGAVVRFEPRDAMRVRAYIAMYGAQIETQGAEIRAVEVDTKRHMVTIYVNSHGQAADAADAGSAAEGGVVASGGTGGTLAGAGGSEGAAGQGAAEGGARGAGDSSGASAGRADGTASATTTSGVGQGEQEMTVTLHVSVLSLTPGFRVASVRQAGAAGAPFEVLQEVKRGGGSGSTGAGTGSSVGGQPGEVSGRYRLPLSALHATVVEVVLEALLEPS